MRFTSRNWVASIATRSRLLVLEVAAVVEVVSDYRGDTFRAVYTVRFAKVLYVLHAFQKKSKTGRETPKSDIELIEVRLKEAERIAKNAKEIRS